MQGEPAERQPQNHLPRARWPAESPLRRLECHRDPTPHIRPAGVSVTQMDWLPTEASIAAARRQLEWQGENPPELNPPTHCAACHR